MAALFRSLKAFFLRNNVGRGLFVLVILTSSLMLLSKALSFLPHGAGSYISKALVCGVLGIAISYYIFLRAFHSNVVFIGTGSTLRRVFESMRTAHRPPRPPFWAYGCHVQFAPWIIYNLIAASVTPLRYEEQTLRVQGLEDKTKPESESNPRSMADDVVLSYFPPVSVAADPVLPLDAPVILFEPGLTCTAQDIPGSSLPRRAVGRGFRVVVIERRGHARPLQKPRWNLFGDSDDLEQIYKAVRERCPDAPFFYVGISSGSKLPIEAVGKFDERRKHGDMSAPSFVATSCLCPGYNLETCFMGFKFPYNYICVSSVKSKFLHDNEPILRDYDAASYEKALASADLQSLLSHVAPFAGYSCAEEYFAVENPVLFASQITTPTLIINSFDDPCTVPQNAFGTMPGSSDGLTFTDMVEKSPCGILLMSPSGSHCPFLDGQFWPFVRVPLALGGLVIASWADSCILEFFEGYLAEEKKSR